jgi:hypothetical protein
VAIANSVGECVVDEGSWRTQLSTTNLLESANEHRECRVRLKRRLRRRSVMPGRSQGAASDAEDRRDDPEGVSTNR